MKTKLETALECLEQIETGFPSVGTASGIAKEGRIALMGVIAERMELLKVAHLAFEYSKRQYGGNNELAKLAGAAIAKATGGDK